MIACDFAQKSNRHRSADAQHQHERAAEQPGKRSQRSAAYYGNRCRHSGRALAVAQRCMPARHIDEREYAASDRLDIEQVDHLATYPPVSVAAATGAAATALPPADHLAHAGDGAHESPAYLRGHEAARQQGHAQQVGEGGISHGKPYHRPRRHANAAIVKPQPPSASATQPARPLAK